MVDTVTMNVNINTEVLAQRLSEETELPHSKCVFIIEVFRIDESIADAVSEYIGQLKTNQVMKDARCAIIEEIIEEYNL